MSIDISEEAGVRYLHFGSTWIQGAMRIARPFALELEYTREMMAGLLLHPEPDWPRRVLLIGLGAASLTKFLYRHRPEARLTVVEIDPQVIAAARQYFRLPDDRSRIDMIIGDGAQYVMKKTRPFDLILVDGYDADARAGDLDTVPFYLNCRARLSDDGLLVANVLSRRGRQRESLVRLREAFGERAMMFPPCDSGNAIAIAAAGAPIHAPLADLRERAAQLKRETGLSLTPMVMRLQLASPGPGGSFEL